MSKAKNRKKESFLAKIPEIGIDESNIHERCKFNFSYFDSSQVGQSFADWNKVAGIDSLQNLMEKVVNYTTNTLDYWNNQRVGGGSLKVFEIYEGFPAKSEFTHPRHVPHDVLWARFRMGNKVRLIGFVIPEVECNKVKDCGGKPISLDRNTFYVVFLDKDHVFYKTEDK